MMLVVSLVTVLFFTHTTSALNNGLARTPPMGWLSWERFRCNIDCANDPANCISERLYKDMADRLAADGFKDAGYHYVNIDDCWASHQRDANMNLVPDPQRFPDGIKKLADYVHDKGLKLGIYGDMGILTCGGYPGSKFTLQGDADIFAKWGVDSLKLDGCYSKIDDFPYGYPDMEFFLNKTGRQILYSCSWPAYYGSKIPDYTAIAKSCNIWRNFDDIADSWDSVKNIIKFYGDDKGNFSKVSGPGAFNDPDMLIIGNTGLSPDQEKVQMAMWSIMAAPLYISADLRKIRPSSRDLLLNKGALAINQDKLGIMGRRLWQSGDLQGWSRPVTPKGSFAIALLNLNDGGYTKKVSVKLSDLGINSSGSFTLTEVFTGSKVGVFNSSSTLTVNVDQSSVFFGKLTVQ